MKCFNCPRDVDPNDSRTLFEVTGWERKREQGGQNHVRFRKQTGRLMCPVCETSFRYTAGQGHQATLLEA